MNSTIPKLMKAVGPVGAFVAALLLATSVRAQTVLNFATQPQSVTTYAYQPVYFSASATNDAAVTVTYQWRTNGVDIPNGTNSTCGFTTSTNDDGAQVDCVATAGALMATSEVATLTLIPGVIITNNVLARDFWGTADWSLEQIESGASGPQDLTYYDMTSVDVSGLGQYVIDRVRGFFIPPVTTNYVFFMISDNHADLFLSTSDQPNQMQMIAQNTAWVATPDDWNLAGGYSGDLNTANVRSDTFSPDGGATTPFASGIPLTAGQKYYIEIDYWDNDGGGWFGVNYIYSGGSNPADNSPSIITSTELAAAQLPLSVVNFSTQPQNATAYAYQPVYFSASATNDGGVSTTYQWRNNGVDIPNATSSTLCYTTWTNDNGAQIDCVATAGALTATSQVATLTILPGIIITNNVLARDFWNTANWSLQQIESGASGPPDQTYYDINNLDVSGLGQYVIDRVRGFFIPPTTTNYVFFMISDNHADLFLSTSDEPSQKRMIAQNTDWVASPDDWELTSATGGNLIPGNVRSDTFSPDGGATTPYSGGIALTAGQRYYIEIDYWDNDGGQWFGVNYKYSGDTDPADGSPSIITSANLAAAVVPLTAIGFVSQPQSVTDYAYQPVYFSAAATNNGGVITTYQWRKNGVDIPNATANTYGFITSTNDNGAQIDCVATAASPVSTVTATSQVATVTVSPGGTLVSGALARDFWGTSAWTLQQIESGASGPPDNTYYDITNLDLSGLGQYIIDRVRGFFIPPVTTNYVFYMISDNHADLFLSTSDQPDQAQMIAQNTAWVYDVDDWELAYGGSGDLNPDNVCSATFSPDGGATQPFAGGIWLTNGQRYYIEVDYWDNDGGQWFGVNYKYFGDVAPADFSPSIITSANLAYMAPGSPTQPVLTITRSGSSVNVSWTPTGGTLLSKTNLTDATWSTVGTANPANIPIGSGNLFLRVVQ
jgi:hypothetical protein